VSVYKPEQGSGPRVFKELRYWIQCAAGTFPKYNLDIYKVVMKEHMQENFPNYICIKE